MQYRKAVSTLIATLLIIGIVISVFVMIYSFIMPLIKEGVQESESCADAHLNIIEEEFTCYNHLTQKLDVHVSRGQKEVLISGIQIIYSEAGNSLVYSINSSDIIQPGDEKVYEIDYSDSGFTNIDSLSIAVVIGSENRKRICNPSPEISVSSCL